MTDRLIHWRSTPAGVCARKDSQADADVHEFVNGSSMTFSGEADHPGNVTCPVCRRAIRQAARR